MSYFLFSESIRICKQQSKVLSQWHTLQKLASESGVEFMAPVSGACVRGFRSDRTWVPAVLDSCHLLLTRNSSGDEIANVNFLYDDIVHARKIDSCINCATDRFLQPKFTKFSEITQCLTAITPFKVIQGHRFWYQSKAHIRLPISD